MVVIYLYYINIIRESLVVYDGISHVLMAVHGVSLCINEGFFACKLAVDKETEIWYNYLNCGDVGVYQNPGNKSFWKAVRSEIYMVVPK